jgi:hypothetical protein
VRRETFKAPDSLTVDISNASGRIEVEAAETDEAVVDLEPLRDNDASHRAVEEATVELRGSRLVVDVEDRSFFGLSLNANRDVRVAVRVPRGTSVVANGAAADIDLRGPLGATQVKTASGDGEGETIEGDLRVKSASADVEVAHVSGAADVQSASGDVSLARVDGDVRIRTASGDVEIGDARRGVNVQTASGDQALAAVAQGRVDLKSASGDIRVGIRRGSRVWLDVRSLSGDAESELDVADAPGDEEGPLVELTAMSMSGDIRIERAEAASQA